MGRGRDDQTRQPPGYWYTIIILSSSYVIYCRLGCGQRGSTCARHITLDWIRLLGSLFSLFSLLFDGAMIQTVSTE